MNLVFQLLLGLPLEIVHKWWRLMIIYFCGVLGGSLAHSVTDYYVNLVGASGGCYAILGAHLASVIVVSKTILLRKQGNLIHVKLH
jgi:rhomboid-related protein 1/2/3